MMKWLKRLFLYPLLVLILAISVFLMFNKDIYYSLIGTYGSQLMWYGYEEKGSQIVEKSLGKIQNLNENIFHAYSVQNTKNGNYDEAIEYLEKAAKINSKEVDGYFGWVLLYYYRDYKKSLFHLNRLDSSTDYVDYVGDDNILYAKGLCYKQLGDYTKALELFAQSIQHDLDNYGEKWVSHQMYFQMGRTLHLLNKYEEAINYYDKAINNWSGSSESIYYKGLAEIELGIESGCDNLELALEELIKGRKSTDSYVKLFDEIYLIEVQEMIAKKCIY